MSDDYRFPGMVGFVARDGLTPSFVPKITANWLLCRVGDALSQIPTARPEDRAEMYRVAREARDALHVCLTTANAAIDEVTKHCPPLADPDTPPVPKADPHAATRAAVRGAVKDDPIPVEPDHPKSHGHARGGK